MFEEEADIFQKKRRKGIGVATLASMTREIKVKERKKERKYLLA